MSKVAIRCTDARVSYTVRTHRPLIRGTLRGQRPDARVIEAVRGVTFDVAVGESVGVIGPNGSGKTSLLQATTGLLPLAGGQVLVRSTPAFLGVQAVLRPHLTGWRNIRLGLLAQGLHAAAARGQQPGAAAWARDRAAGALGLQHAARAGQLRTGDEDPAPAAARLGAGAVSFARQIQGGRPWDWRRSPT